MIIKQKKSRRKMLLDFFASEDLRKFKRISNKAALEWLEEANRFLYKSDPKRWQKEEALMKKIGW